MEEMLHTETFTVRNPAGMHLRPSNSIVSGLQNKGIYKGDVVIIHNNTRAQAHDAIAILALGMQKDTEFTVEMNELDSEQIKQVRGIINKACMPMYEFGHTWNKNR